MRIVVAPDSFKESLSASEAARAIASGIRLACPKAEVVEIPMADGGEGTVDALVHATHGNRVSCTVTGPLGDAVEGFFGMLGGLTTAVVEMAAASGLHLVPQSRRDPRVTTTRGTGELIACALKERPARIIVGIGGSATNDGGAGMAQALGYRLLDAEAKELPQGGAALIHLDRILPPAKRPWEDAEIIIASDVTNPLVGPNGASHVYGPQKGASPDVVEELDRALAHFAEIVRSDLHVEIAELPGAGAAGGLGGGLVAFLGASMQRGVEVMAAASGLADRIEGADLVITAEGCLDGQSIHGKTPVGVARIARAQGVPCIALAGALRTGYKATYTDGITAAFAIGAGPESLESAMANTADHLEGVTESIMRLWLRAAGRHA